MCGIFTRLGLRYYHLDYSRLGFGFSTLLFKLISVQTRTTAILLVSVFLHAIAFFASSYYLPLYFQVLGNSATGAGVRYVNIPLKSLSISLILMLACRVIPITVGSALVAIVAGQYVARIGGYRSVMWFGWTIMTLGFGLMTMLDENSNKYIDFYPALPFTDADFILVQRKFYTCLFLLLASAVYSRYTRFCAVVCS